MYSKYNLKMKRWILNSVSAVVFIQVVAGNAQSPESRFGLIILKGYRKLGTFKKETCLQTYRLPVIPERIRERAVSGQCSCFPGNYNLNNGRRIIIGCRFIFYYLYIDTSCPYLKKGDILIFDELCAES
jgi:hypothetical protein